MCIFHEWRSNKRRITAEIPTKFCSTIKTRSSHCELLTGDKVCHLRLTCRQSTYEYGKQLLQAALALRRSMHLDLEPNTEQASRLAHAWRLFSKGVNEQSVRNNSAAMFLQQSDDVSSTRIYVILGSHIYSMIDFCFSRRVCLSRVRSRK